MKKYGFAIAIVALTLWPAAPAHADNVEVELKAMAEQVAASLKDQKIIKIGKFTNKDDASSFYGPEIVRVLGQEFAKLKLAVDGTAKIEISGDYRKANKDPERPNQTETFLRIDAHLVDTASGEKLDSVRIVSRLVYGNELLSAVFAPNANIPPDADRKEENDRLREGIDKPKFHLSGSRISSKEGSPFSVEVLVVNDKDAKDPDAGAAIQKASEGQPFVQIKRGQFYRLKIHNNEKFDVAVKIAIDGLDQFVFSDKDFRKDSGEPKYNYRIIPKGKAVTISGWFRTLKDFDYFVVTEYAKSASAELKRDPAEAGQIALQFHACWEKDADKPADEPKTRSADDATGRVPGGKENLKEVNITAGVLRDVIGVRYGSIRP